MKSATLLSSLSKVASATSERDALVAALEVYQQVVSGHHYTTMYGRVGCGVVDVFQPGVGWLGVDAEFSKLVALHHADHPFCTDFFAHKRPAVYLRSALISESDWHRTSIYKLVDHPLGIKDMIGLYFTTPAGQFGALFCGRGEFFKESEFASAEDFHAVMARLLGKIPAAPVVAGEEESLCLVTHLTTREVEVMHWLVEGKSNCEMGVILGISQHTVRKHLENIFVKLGVENRTAAVHSWIEKSQKIPISCSSVALGRCPLREEQDAGTHENR